MSRAGKALAVWILISFTLTGCWDIKNIQDINYLTSLGFDKVGQQYRVYVQMIDFSSVAKSESAKPTEPIPVWVGIGKGETIVGAVNDLYRTAQLRVFYGQINSIVLGENILRSDLKDVKEVLDRYYEFRYTPWLFGTKEPIDKLFAVTPFFNLSPLMSLLHQPQEIYKQQSLIAPLTLREFVAEIREPGNAVFIPSLSLRNLDWEVEGQKKPMMDMDGVFAFQEEKYKQWIALPKVFGLRWVEPKTERSPLLIRSEGRSQASVSLEKPDIRIHPVIVNDQIAFNLDVKLSGYISEALQLMPETTLEQKAAEAVKRQIQDTYEAGLRSGIDTLRLEHALYRQNNREWKKLRGQGGIKLTPDSVHIRVKVKLRHSGKLKY
ncbi:Ger(x)C family spore germination protein [Paenibacillus ginsengihumi]|uniref:Ger(x)C family spore germination protein n=1 Tax=Paenibacillus ginsengihumi TaxID=431596 RepID=UPI0003770F76|nr:Ger(x)C family spore germination protein [Paenibacillus ginsengihumi]